MFLLLFHVADVQDSYQIIIKLQTKIKTKLNLITIMKFKVKLPGSHVKNRGNDCIRALPVATIGGTMGQTKDLQGR